MLPRASEFHVNGVPGVVPPRGMLKSCSVNSREFKTRFRMLSLKENARRRCERECDAEHFRMPEFREALLDFASGLKLKAKLEETSGSNFEFDAHKCVSEIAERRRKGVRVLRNTRILTERPV